MRCSSRSIASGRESAYMNEIAAWKVSGVSGSVNPARIQDCSSVLPVEVIS